MEDQGLYGCTANNSAGKIRTEAFVYIACKSNLSLTLLWSSSVIVLDKNGIKIQLTLTISNTDNSNYCLRQIA